VATSETAQGLPEAQDVAVTTNPPSQDPLQEPTPLSERDRTYLLSKHPVGFGTVFVGITPAINYAFRRKTSTPAPNASDQAQLEQGPLQADRVIVYVTVLPPGDSGVYNFSFVHEMQVFVYAAKITAYNNLNMLPEDRWESWNGSLGGGTRVYLNETSTLESKVFRPWNRPGIPDSNLTLTVTGFGSLAEGAQFNVRHQNKPSDSS